MVKSIAETKMGQLICAVFLAVVFTVVCKVDGQSQDCFTALSAVSGSSCLGSLTSGNTTETCNGTCLAMFNEVFNNCSTTVDPGRSVYSEFEIVCVAPAPGCFNAKTAIEGDLMCHGGYNANYTGFNDSYVCNGTCRNLLDDILTGCGAVIYYEKLPLLISDICVPSGGGSNSTNATNAPPTNATTATTNPTSPTTSPTSPTTSPTSPTTNATSATTNATSATTNPTSESATTEESTSPTVNPLACLDATTALFNTTLCANALQQNNTATICAGTCKPLLEGIANACGDTGTITQDDITQECGGAGAVKAMGIISLLLMAIVAVLMP